MSVQTGSLLGQTTSDAVGFSGLVCVPVVLFHQVISCFLFISMGSFLQVCFLANCIIRGKWLLNKCLPSF